MKRAFEIQGMTIAVTHMPEMLDFYTNVFDISFHEIEMMDYKLYSGSWGDLSLLLCPAPLAQNTATQNRHQFDIIVPDIDQMLNVIQQHGGKQMGEITEDEQYRNVGVYDPDNNSMVLKQLKDSDS